MTRASRDRRSCMTAWSFAIPVACGLLVLLSLALAACGSSAGSGGSKSAAPDFQVQTFAYENVSLSTFRGKPLVLAFMASW